MSLFVFSTTKNKNKKKNNQPTSQTNKHKTTLKYPLENVKYLMLGHISYSN